MDKKTFLELHKDDIVAEPSGRTYAELQTDKIGKFMIIKSLKNSDSEQY